ncbi:MAG: FAD-dependent 5-carboxymethylaminomethyl-2-thiouridine(34) oxidoreductase MnmC [Natronospirillum sp.]
MQFADIELRHNVPAASQFDDLYYSQQGGLAETYQVFLQHNDLPARLPKALGEYFAIGETGFGIGLNFLTTWQAWRNTRPTQQTCGRLHFVSTEKYPVHPAQLPDLLAPFSDQLPVLQEFLRAYRSLTPGWNRFSFDDVELTLYIGDAAEGLWDCRARIDAWFLDGFAPAKNADIWRSDIYTAMAYLSHQSTTVATYTAASAVREGLAGAGFSLERVPGFGLKRHMLRGRFIGLHGPQPFKRQDFWWPRPVPLTPTLSRIAIIGAGLAAAELAPRLHQRGFSVTLIAPSSPGQAASGNAQGAVYAKPGLEADPATCFYAQALSYRLRHWHAHGGDWPGAQCGLLQLLTPARWQRLADQLSKPDPEHPFAQLMSPVSAERASELAGVTLSQPGLWFADSGWLSPTDYCQKQLEGFPHHHTTADALTYHPPTKQWQVRDGRGQDHRFEGVVIAAGHLSANWSQTAWLPIKPVRGQVSSVQAPGAPNTVICGHQYVTPADAEGTWSFGASFDVNTDHSETTTDDQNQNRLGLQALAPELACSVAGVRSTERAGVRATTPDYLPLVGPLLCDQVRQRNPRHCFQPWADLYQPNLYVLTGLGSKGLASASLLAEYLTCQITGEPLPFGRTAELRIHPGRHWLRR